MPDNAAMPIEHSADSPAVANSSPFPTDDFLISNLLDGDAAALNKLMDRYDRLVRYTVLRASKSRCTRDPQWLESIASATWVGFIRSIRQNPDLRPRSLRAYLVRIAGNQVVTALRSSQRDGGTVSIEPGGDGASITAGIEEPIETLARLELLDVLRTCLNELGLDDRTMIPQIHAITERRWKEAAASLEVSESTLRSRWQRVLERLRTCVKRKTGAISFASKGPTDDS